MNSPRLSDHLQIWSIEADSVLFADGSLGFALKTTPVDPLCWDSSQCNGFAEKVGQFLNGLPPNLDIQFLQDIKGGNESIISSHETSTNHVSPVVDAMTRARCERLRDLDAQGLLPNHETTVFVRQRSVGPLLKRPKIFRGNSDFSDIAERALRHELERLQQTKRDIQSSMDLLGLKSEVVSGQDLIEMIYSQWNPAREIGLGAYDPNDLRHSLLFTDAGINDRGFSLGDFHYRVLSLKILPDQTYSTMAARLRELPFDSRLFVTIHVPDQQQEIDSLKTQRRIAYSMVAGKKGLADLESRAKLQDLEQLLEEMVAQGEKVFHFSLQVVLRSKAQDNLNAQVSEALLKIRELGGAEGMEETLAGFDIFSQVAIPNARAKERIFRLKTSNLRDLVPVYGPWAGHDDAKIILRSRLGNLLRFNPFSPHLTNSNQIVSGGSGSGKSYMTNILLMQMMNESPRIFIIDIGGSYRRICETFDGQYIQLGPDCDLAMNPFDLNEGEAVPSSHKIKFLLGLIEIMTKEEESSHLGKLERSEIESAVESVYANVENPNLSALRQNLLSHTDKSLQRLGKILSSWTGQSPYGKFVDRSTTLKLEKSIVCFDLKGMEAYPDLQAACLFIITDFVWREIQRDRAKPKFLVLDECWKLMEHDSASLFIAEVFRTFRKYMASAIAISQNIDDFARSKIATAILPNSSIKWVLKQKGADPVRLKDVLGLNDKEMDLIASLQQERGVFSEAFLMAEDHRSVVVIESTPLEYWLATSDARDIGKIEEVKREHPEFSQIEILRLLAERFPKGFASHGVST